MLIRTLGVACSQCKTCSSKEFLAEQRRRVSSFVGPSISSLRKRNSVAANSSPAIQPQNYLTLPNPEHQQQQQRERKHQRTSSGSNNFVENRGSSNEFIMGIKLYSVSDSPPTIAVRMAMKYLGIEPELINVDYGNGEQVSEEFRKKNPQGEVPLIDDNGFLLSESVAILQYLAEKYRKDDTFYPLDPQKRAIVNHRLAFHLSTYYKAVLDYQMLPLCYAYARTDDNLKKLVHALKVLEEYMIRNKTAYVASDNLTIADLPLIEGTVCLEAMGLDISPFPKIKEWYDSFKVRHSDLWVGGGAKQGLEELTNFEKNPPDLSHVKHPIHPTDKSKLK